MNQKYTFITLFVILFSVFFYLQALTQNAVVTIGGEVEKPLKLNAAAMQQMKQANVQAFAHKDRKQHDYSEVPLSEIIK